MDTDAAPRLQRHLAVFDDKITTAQHTFSARTFHEMTKILKAQKPVGRITTMGELREIIQDEPLETISIGVDMSMETKAARQKRVKHRKVIAYFRWFLDFFDYLKAMKQNFDTKIHKQLLQVFYDKLENSAYETPDMEDSGEPESTSFSPSSSDLSALCLDNADEFTRNITKDIMKEYRYISDIYENKDIDTIAEKLLRASRKLENLIREDMDLDTTLSKIPKPHDGKKDIGDDVFNFIHLMNSIFAKFKQIIEISRTWLETDARRMKILQEKLHKLKDCQRKLSRKLTDLGFAIRKHELELERESNGLQVLLKREERCNDLNALLYDVDQATITIKDNLARARDERDSIARDLLTVPASDKVLFQELKKRYEQNRLNRFILSKELQSKEYQRTLVKEDHVLEMDFKPSVIRFTDHAQETCERIETILDKERGQKYILENVLGPLQQDRQRIEGELLRQIMIDSEKRHSQRENVWGPARSGRQGATNKLVLPEPQLSDTERIGSGKMALCDPKFSISEADELGIKRTQTVDDPRPSRLETLRNIESDPLLSRHNTVEYEVSMRRNTVTELSGDDVSDRASEGSEANSTLSAWF